MNNEWNNESDFVCVAQSIKNVSDLIWVKQIKSVSFKSFKCKILAVVKR